MSKLLNAAAAATRTQPENTATPAARRLALTSIRLDGGTQPRAALSQEHIDDLAADLRAGATLPPIDVMYDGSVYWLFDGYHRLHAHKAAFGVNAAIDVRVHQGEQQDAQWASFAVNKAHGLRRTTEDKQRAIVSALKHPKGVARSNREIARHLGVDDKTVGEWRKKLESTAEIPQSDDRLGADGRTINTINIGAAPGKLNLPLRMATSSNGSDESAAVLLTNKEIEAVFFTELGRRVTSGLLADKIEWLRQHRTFDYYAGFLSKGKTSTNEAFTTIADRLIADFEDRKRALDAYNQRTAASFGKLGRFVSPNPPADDEQANQETVTATPTTTDTSATFDAAHFAAQMRTLSEHLEQATPLLRELLAYCPADLISMSSHSGEPVSNADVDRLIDLAAIARLCEGRATAGKIV